MPTNRFAAVQLTLRVQGDGEPRFIRLGAAQVAAGLQRVGDDPGAAALRREILRSP